MSVIVYTDKKGDSYGFCSRACVDFWKRYQEDPEGALHKPPEPAQNTELGCWWCGDSLLTKEGIQWLDSLSLQ